MDPWLTSSLVVLSAQMPRKKKYMFLLLYNTLYIAFTHDESNLRKISKLTVPMNKVRYN